MLGAILGDIIGSPYEFDCNNIKTKNFPLFTKISHFTDDTVMTLAVAEGLILGYRDKERTRAEIIKSMRTFGRMYPYAGYGNRFVDWLHSEDPQAIIAFLEGTDFEDVIRTAVSLGGDSDTLAAIAGSIAEAYYGISDELIVIAKEKLDDYLFKKLQFLLV